MLRWGIVAPNLQCPRQVSFSEKVIWKMHLSTMEQKTTILENTHQKERLKKFPLPNYLKNMKENVLIYYTVLVISLLSCTHQPEMEKTTVQFMFGPDQYRQIIDLPSEVSEKIKKIVHGNNYMTANDLMPLIRMPRGHFIVGNRKYLWTDLGTLETNQNGGKVIYTLPKTFYCNALSKYPLLDIEKEGKRWFNENTRENWEKTRDEYINFFIDLKENMD